MRRMGLSVVVALLGQSAHAQQVGDTYDKGSQVRVGQYSTQSTLPGQTVSDPLAVFVQLNFPRQGVTSIGDALHYTLLRTGWSLDLAQLQPAAVGFLRLPLPESQRSVGTFRVRDVLQALVGSTWEWREDPVRRALWVVLSEQAVQAQAVVATPVPAWTPLEVKTQPAAPADARHSSGDQQ